jgi:hypothetical protein
MAGYGVGLEVPFGLDWRHVAADAGEGAARFLDPALRLANVTWGRLPERRFGNCPTAADFSVRLCHTALSGFCLLLSYKDTIRAPGMKETGKRRAVVHDPRDL